MSRSTHSNEVGELPQLLDIAPLEDLRNGVGARDEEELGVGGAIAADVGERVDRVGGLVAVDVDATDREAGGFEAVAMTVMRYRCSAGETPGLYDG